MDPAGRQPNLHRTTTRRKTARRHRGQATFEFMLVLPFFVGFLLLMVDFGVLMYEYVSVANAAREGARYASTKCSASSQGSSPKCVPDSIIVNGVSIEGIKDRTIARSGGILANKEELTVTWLHRGLNSGSSPLKGDSYVVNVNHSYQFMFVPGNPTINVHSCADMRLEIDDSSSTVTQGAACP